MYKKEALLHKKESLQFGLYRQGILYNEATSREVLGKM